MSRKFTEKNVVFASPGRHYLGDGLCLIVAQDKQTRRWIFRYTNPATKRVTETGLGPHPVVTLEDAKAKTLELRRLIRSGIDPVTHKKAERQAATTLREASDAFIEQHRRHWTPGYLTDWHYMIDVHDQQTQPGNSRCNPIGWLYMLYIQNNSDWKRLLRNTEK
jgi:Arm DNA-binding domain